MKFLAVVVVFFQLLALCSLTSCMQCRLPLSMLTLATKDDINNDASDVFEEEPLEAPRPPFELCKLFPGIINLLEYPFTYTYIYGAGMSLIETKYGDSLRYTWLEGKYLPEEQICRTLVHIYDEARPTTIPIFKIEVQCDDDAQQQFGPTVPGEICRATKIINILPFPRHLTLHGDLEPYCFVLLRTPTIYQVLLIQETTSRILDFFNVPISHFKHEDPYFDIHPAQDGRYSLILLGEGSSYAFRWSFLEPIQNFFKESLCEPVDNLAMLAMLPSLQQLVVYSPYPTASSPLKSRIVGPRTEIRSSSMNALKDGHAFHLRYSETPRHDRCVSLPSHYYLYNPQAGDYLPVPVPAQFSRSTNQIAYSYVRNLVYIMHKSSS